MAKLKTHLTTMRSGKSTMALQINYNFGNDKNGLLLSCLHDEISSRMNIYLSKKSIKIDNHIDIMSLVLKHNDIKKIDYIIIDEAQFLTNKQVDDIGTIVDELDIDIYTFGLLTNFRGVMFEGSKRLVEISDELIDNNMIKSLCWCGKKAVFNSRIDKDGYMILDGEEESTGERYEVLCRRHYKEKITKKAHLDSIE